MSLSSKIIPGPSHNQNRGACHWGNQGFIAYGCQQYVVVVDPQTLQTIQVVNKHATNVVSVKWNNEDFHHDIVHPYSLTLASGDASGVVCVLSVVSGDTKMEFREKNKAVRDMCWLNNKDTGDAALLVLYSGSTLALWDCSSTARLWRTSFMENMTTIAIDPFKSTTAAFLADDNIVIIEDLNWESPPGNTATKISFSGKNTGTAQIRRNSSSLNKLINLTTTLITKESKPSRKNSSEDQSPAPQCLHISYHPAIRHWLLMVFSDHMDIVDIDVSIVIGTIKLDTNASPFVRVIPCRQRDALICLHENSSITIRLRREDTSHCSYDDHALPASPLTPESPGEHSTPHMIRDVAYDLVWQSDTMRLTSSSTVFGYEIHPVSECSACLVCNDGKIVIWELISTKLPSRNVQQIPATSLSHFVPNCLRRGTRNQVTKNVKFLQTGILRGSAHAISVVRTNVLDAVAFHKETSDEGNQLAVGTEEGSIHIVDLQSGQVEKEYSVHFDVVRGIEWIDKTMLISWAYQQGSNSQSHGRNEIILLNLKSGKCERFREHNTVESLIHILKISPLRQYVIISFKDHPIEIWGLKTKTLVRELPSSTMHPRDIVWSTLSTWRTVKKTVDTKLSKICATGESEDSIKKLSHEEISSMLRNIQLKRIAKEKVLLADKDGMICRLTLEDRSITDITTYPTEVNGMTTLTHITMKSDILLMTDANGMISLINFADKRMKNIPKADKAGMIIRKIAFHPSSEDHLFFVLHDNGVDVYSILKDDKVKTIGIIRSSRNLRKIVDVDWASTKHLVIVTQDGAIHVRNFSESNPRHPMNGRSLPDPVFCPYVLSSQGIPLMKHALQRMTSQGVKLVPEQKALQEDINTLIALIDTDVASFLRNPKSSMIEKCMITSRLFGDEFDLRFWTLAANMINDWKCSQNSTERNQLISVESNITSLKVPLFDIHSNSRPRDKHVCTESQYDVLMQQCCFWNQQLHRHRLHDKRRTTMEHRSVCVDNYILLGQIEDAVRLLLETNFQEEGYREDYLRACLLSSDRNNTTGQSTLKLVATHLIINGKLDEGVGVIRLMGKTADGCKYLQQYGAWEKAAWLAKAVLTREECSEIFNKWTEYLVQSKNMVDAVFVMLAEKRFYHVAKSLLQIGFLDTAACFVEACQEVGIDLQSQDTDNTIKDFLPTYEKHLERLGIES